MRRDDVILDPRTSVWRVTRATEDALRSPRPDDPSPDVLVAALGDADPSDVRPALDVLGVDVDEVLATHEPEGTTGTVTTVLLPPGTHAVRRVLLVESGTARRPPGV